jgi:hypothetical protein
MTLQKTFDLGLAGQTRTTRPSIANRYNSIAKFAK